jgi:predicted carbohydrate-binding protein with CBM5 and CBM33 domain
LQDGRVTGRWAAVLVCGLGLAVTGCGSGSGTATPPPATTYTMTASSANPASGAPITVTPADTKSLGNGTTAFTRTYNAGTAVTLTAAATAGGNVFSSWTGCASVNGTKCSVTMSGNQTVTANYTTPHTAVTYYVSGTGNDSGDGLTAATAFLTLQPWGGRDAAGRHRLRNEWDLHKSMSELQRVGCSHAGQSECLDYFQGISGADTDD